MASGSPDWTSRAATPNLWEEVNGTVNTVGVIITFSGTASSIYIENTGDTNNLLYSLDAGVSFGILVPGQNKSIDVSQASVILVSAAATTDYVVEITYG